jgi:hypothetical protein
MGACVNPLPVVMGLMDWGRSVWSKRDQRKQDLQTAQLKLQSNREGHQQSVELTEAEARALQQKGKPATWVDEYLTVIVTSPYPLLIVACFVFVFTGDDRMLRGVKMSITELNNMGDGMAGYLMGGAVCVGLGIKFRAR